MDVGLGVVVGVVSEWDAGWGVEVELWVWGVGVGLCCVDLERFCLA